MFGTFIKLIVVILGIIISSGISVSAPHPKEDIDLQDLTVAEKEDEEEVEERNWQIHPHSHGSSVQIPDDLSELSGRKFVVLRKLGSGREIEVPLVFKGSPPKRNTNANVNTDSMSMKVLDDVGMEVEGDVEALLRVGRQQPPPTPPNNILTNGTGNTTTTTTPTPTTTTTLSTTTTTPPPLNVTWVNGTYLILDSSGERLTPELLAKISRHSADYDANLVYIYYTHLLTALERAGDSLAKWGDRCAPKPIIIDDWCEMAFYPNKNKLFCFASQDRDFATKLGITPNSCTCKFYNKRIGWRVEANEEVKVERVWGGKGCLSGSQVWSL